MIQELLTIGLPLAKFILAAALMVFFYKLLYKDKTTFNHCRIFLLSIAFVSLLVSQFNIVVYTPPAKIVEIKVPQFIPVVALKSVETPTSVQPAVLEKTHPFQKKIQEFLTVKNSLLLTYILIAFVLLVSLFIQFFKIQAAKRKGNVILQDGYEMVMSPDIAAPFSFHKSIFIGTNLTGSKLEMIVKHEQWHIKHHHYLDVLVMEMLVRIFWFNPVLWWVRKELRNVSEFQADRSVLDEGHDLYKYQTIILEEVMAHNPYLANGFNNSFTKKRFIMMKNKCQIRMTTLRRVLILPFLVGVFSLLSLSVGKSQVKYVTTTTNGNLTVTKTVEKESENSPNSTTTIDSTFGTGNNKSTTFTVNMDKAYSSEDDVDKAINDISKGLGLAVIELNKLAANPNVAYRKASILKVFLSLDVKASNTKVDSFPFSDEFIASFTQEDFKKSAENYSKIKTNIDKLKKEESSSAKTLGLNQQMMMLIQDPFMSKVLNEMLTQAMSKAFGALGGMTGTNVGETSMQEGMSGMLGNMTGLLKNMSGSLSDMTLSSDDSSTSSQKKIAAKIIVNEDNGLSDEEFAKNSYTLKPEQYKEVSMHFIPFSDIYTIEKNENETKVTLVIGIQSAHSWFRINRSAKIIDAKSKDEYILRRVEKNIPIDQMIIAPTGKDKMIAVTLVFPPLKESLKRLDLSVGTFTNNEMPEGYPWDILGVNLDNFLIKESPKVYK